MVARLSVEDSWLHGPGRRGGLFCTAKWVPRGMSTPSKLWATQYSLASQRRHTSSPRLVVESSCGTRMFKWDCGNVGTREAYYKARQHEAVLPLKYSASVFDVVD